MFTRKMIWVIYSPYKFTCTHLEIIIIIFKNLYLIITSLPNHLPMFVIERTESFVKRICNTRDPSHGYHHACQVRDLSISITKELADANIDVEMINIVALCHDVADSKYDYNMGYLAAKLLFFLEQNFQDEEVDKIQRILNIIDYISFSKEKKSRVCASEHPYGSIVLNETDLKIRNIVSDADKLEALGRVGFQRCVQWVLLNPVVGQTLKETVTKHAEDKLYLLLKENYIITAPARNMAIALELELRECIAAMS